jgi:3-oxoacyl-[acyl-carrier protein] reductase
MDFGLKGRVAIVGGASKGIGRACAALLAAEGARVVLASRDAAALGAAAREVASTTGAEALPVPADLSREDDIRRLVQTTADRFGQIDVLVNNAGGPPPGAFDRHDDDAWHHAFELNLMSVVRMVREALPYLKQSSQPRVINITSTAVKEPIDGLILSNSVRLGTTGLAKTLSKELGPFGITVNNVGPGLTLTDRIRPVMEAQAAAQGRPFDDVLRARTERIPTRRIGQPEDVAAMVVFLASAQARQVTGQTILVDGGATGAVM